jgi:hypothetical protein
MALDLHRASRRLLETVMSTTAETLLKVARIVQAPLDGNPRLRTQAACVRMLSDEISRHKSAGPRFSALREQLQEELMTLACL